MSLTDRYVSSSGSGTYAGSTSSATPMSLTTALANAVAGDRINIKADGTYTRSASDVIVNSGSATSPIIFRGYTTTIGDGFQGRTNNNGPLITTNFPLISYNSTFNLNLATDVSNFIHLDSLNITGTISDWLVYLQQNDVLHNCVVANASTNASAGAVDVGGANNLLLDSDMSVGTGGGGSAALVNAATATVLQRMIACRLNGGGSAIGYQGGGATVLLDNTIFNCATAGINLNSTSTTAVLVGNTIDGTSSGDGIAVIASPTNIIVIGDNMLTSNGGWGINVKTAQGMVISFNNRFRGNTSGTITGATDWTSATNFGVVTSGAASDYQNSAGFDYRLVASSPGIAAGLPLSAAIGALQPSAAGISVVQSLQSMVFAPMGVAGY